jgi:hypothetical protein
MISFLPRTISPAILSVSLNFCFLGLYRGGHQPYLALQATGYGHRQARFLDRALSQLIAEDLAANRLLTLWTILWVTEHILSNQLYFSAFY